MTESEAIEEFKQRLELIEKCYRGEVEDYKQALEIGVKALEKQIPRKPITHSNTNIADCPCCGATVRGIKNPFGDWCSNCGQKLDWSDEE